MLAATMPIQSQSASIPDGTTCWLDVIPPTNKTKLVAWLKQKNYKANFIAEPRIHATTGPHGNKVLTYYNPILAIDLRAKKTVFRKGAAMVKELYANGTNKVTGYAVMVKAQGHKNAQKQDWLFYESFSLTGQNASFGRGIPQCAGCHQGGVDYLLSRFRP
jgi:hypothetical protein